MSETLLSPSNVLLFGREVQDLKVMADTSNKDHNPFAGDRTGSNKDLEEQLTIEVSNKRTARFARIYGFSYEGAYHDLPRPMMFLVHGKGTPASEAKPGLGAPKPARAPGEPSLTGLAAADFQFADDIMVWSYDKADYTIRMDVESGMFEQVLLEAYFSDGQPVSGMRVSGMHVSGMHVSGMRVAGMRVSGMRVSGARGRGDAGD